MYNDVVLYLKIGVNIGPGDASDQQRNVLISTNSQSTDQEYKSRYVDERVYL